jgi:hypothetical protein
MVGEGSGARDGEDAAAGPSDWDVQPALAAVHSRIAAASDSVGVGR